MKANKQNIVQQAHPSQAALDAIITLRLYNVGKRDLLAVFQALRCLEHIYGQPLKASAALFKRSLHLNDERVEKELRYQAMSQMIDWIFHDQIKSSLWAAVLSLCRDFRQKLVSFVPRFPVRHFSIVIRPENQLRPA